MVGYPLGLFSISFFTFKSADYNSNAYSFPLRISSTHQTNLGESPSCAHLVSTT